MAMRSFLSGAARTSTRAVVRAALPALLPKAPPVAPSLLGGVAPKICGSGLMPAIPSKAPASLRGGVATKICAADLMPAIPSKAPVVGAGRSRLNTAATIQTTAGRLNAAHSGVTVATKMLQTPGTAVGVSWIAGSSAKPLLAAIPSAARASYYTTAKAAAGVSRGPAWASKLYAARGLSMTTKVPGKPGGGPLRYSLVVCALGAGIALVLYLSSDKIEHADNVVDGELPEFVDWSLGPAFPDVADLCYNYTCGACWAVVAVKSIEARYAIKTGIVLNLSIQQLIDCGAIEGCRGSNLGSAYKYITEAGLTTEKEYPGPPAEGRSLLYGLFRGYSKMEGKPLFRGYCKMEGKPIAVRIEGYERIHPVIVNVNGFFGDYEEGVIELDECPPRSVKAAGRHCLLVVGYGADWDGKKYWKCMNTWGPDWGEAGYVRLRRGGHPHGAAGITECSGFRPLLGKAGL